MSELKTFKVRESYKTRGWTHVKAATIEEAQKLIEDGHGNYIDESEDYCDTEWDTLQEHVPPPNKEP